MPARVVLAAMISSFFWPVFLSASPPPHAGKHARKPAGKNQKSGQGNRSNQQVTAARSRLTEARKSVAAARRSLTQSQQKHKDAVLNRSKTVSELSGKKESDKGLAKAQQKLDSIKEELDQARTVALGVIQARSDYQDAVFAADAAREQLEAYRAEHPNDTVGLKERAEEVARLASIPSQMESDALNEDASYQQVRDQYLEAGKQVRSIRDRLERGFKNNRRFQAAVHKVQQADAEMSRAEDKLKTEEHKAVAAQIALARAAQQSQRQAVSKNSNHRNSHKKSRNARGNKRKR